MMDTYFKDVKSDLREFIKNNFMYASDSHDLDDDTSFLDRGIIDSTGVLEIIDFLEESYDISIENGEVIPDNLDSINRINRFVNRKISG